MTLSKEERSKIGKKSRNRGKRGEREVALFYRDRGLQARRGVQYKGGVNSPDLLVDELDEFFHHEVKYVERLNIVDAMKQSKDESGPGQVALVVHRRNSTPWYVTLSLHDWINVIQRLIGYDDSVNTLPTVKELTRYAKSVISKKEEALSRQEGGSEANNEPSQGRGKDLL